MFVHIVESGVPGVTVGGRAQAAALNYSRTGPWIRGTGEKGPGRRRRRHGRRTLRLRLWPVPARIFTVPGPTARPSADRGNSDGARYALFSAPEGASATAYPRLLLWQSSDQRRSGGRAEARSTNRAGPAGHLAHGHRAADAPRATKQGLLRLVLHAGGLPRQPLCAAGGKRRLRESCLPTTLAA